jgi:uncharacterized protein YegJ (DUF2314 family)
MKRKFLKNIGYVVEGKTDRPYKHIVELKSSVPTLQSNTKYNWLNSMKEDERYFIKVIENEPKYIVRGFEHCLIVYLRKVNPDLTNDEIFKIGKKLHELTVKKIKV